MKFLGTSFTSACVLSCMAAPAVQAQDKPSELSKFDIGKIEAKTPSTDVNSRLTITAPVLKLNRKSSLSVELGRADLKPEYAPPPKSPFVQDLGDNAQMRVKWMALKFGWKF